MQKPYFIVVDNNKKLFILSLSIDTIKMDNLLDYRREPYNIAKEFLLENYPNCKMKGFFGRKEFAENFISTYC